jgi:hypothetical protein
LQSTSGEGQQGTEDNIPLIKADSLTTPQTTVIDKNQTIMTVLLILITLQRKIIRPSFHGCHFPKYDFFLY